MSAADKLHDLEPSANDMTARVAPGKASGQPKAPVLTHGDLMAWDK